MEKDEPEVVHLEWERVEDPTRDPPPVVVVAEPAPKPKSNPVRDYLNQPNPLQFEGMSTLREIVLLALFVLMVSVVVWARG